MFDVLVSKTLVLANIMLHFVPDLVGKSLVLTPGMLCCQIGRFAGLNIKHLLGMNKYYNYDCDVIPGLSSSVYKCIFLSLHYLDLQKYIIPAIFFFVFVFLDIMCKLCYFVFLCLEVVGSEGIACL